MNAIVHARLDKADLGGRCRRRPSPLTLLLMLVACAAGQLLTTTAGAAVPAGQVVAELKPGRSVDAFAAGYGYAVWSESDRDARHTAIWVRDEDEHLEVRRLKGGTVRDLRVIRGPLDRGVRPVAVVGLHCRGTARPPSARCRPLGFPTWSPSWESISAWMYPAFDAKPHWTVAAGRALEDGRMLSVVDGGATERDDRGRVSPTCRATLQDLAGTHGLPAIPGCVSVDSVKLRGRTALVFGEHDSMCGTCTVRRLWSLDVTQPDGGWRALTTSAEGRTGGSGILGAVASADGAFGLDFPQGAVGDDAGPGPRLRRWRTVDATSEPSSTGPPALLPPATTRRWEQLTSTGRELLAVRTDVVRRRGRGPSTVQTIVRVPLTLGSAQDEDAPLGADPGPGIEVLAQRADALGTEPSKALGSVVAGYGTVGWIDDDLIALRDPAGDVVFSRPPQSPHDFRLLRVQPVGAGAPFVKLVYAVCGDARCMSNDGPYVDVRSDGIGRIGLGPNAAVQDDLLLQPRWNDATPGQNGGSTCEYPLQRIGQGPVAALPSIPDCGGTYLTALRGSMALAVTRQDDSTRTIHQLQVLDRSAADPRWVVVATPGRDGFGIKRWPTLTATALYALHYSYNDGIDGPGKAGRGVPVLSRYPLAGIATGVVPQRQALDLPRGLAEQITALAGDEEAVYVTREWVQVLPGRPARTMSQVLRIPASRWG